jgi:hypothetical protein
MESQPSSQLFTLLQLTNELIISGTSRPTEIFARLGTYSLLASIPLVDSPELGRKAVTRTLGPLSARKSMKNNSIGDEAL